jgi:hypothetical protein
MTNHTSSSSVLDPRTLDPGAGAGAGGRYSDQLEREWQALRFDRRSLRTVNSWDLLNHRISDLDEVLVATGARCRRLRAAERISVTGGSTSGDDAAAERVLLGLLGIAVTDDLAGRIVLQRLLPALLTLTRVRLSRGHCSGQLEELIGAAWIVIRTFDRSRRPSCLAAALVRSAEHIAYKAAERRRSSTEVVIDADRLPVRDAPADPSALEELATLVRDLQINDDDRRLIGDLLEAGSTEVLAARCGVTARTIRNRRSALVTRIRQAIPAV